MASTALETKEPSNMESLIHTVFACDSKPNNMPPCLSGMRIYSEARSELDRIRHAHPTLAPTGCTPQFCQAGRQARINEPRVGRDRPLAEVKQEAEEFLRECRAQGIIASDLNLESRLLAAFSDIAQSTIQTQVTDANGNTFEGLAGGTWLQTAAELEYGIRAAWRNSRRCIMRSEHEGLALADLRKETTSRSMAHAIVKGMLKALNNGRIQPTTFVFPPRSPTQRGPMIWNSQILSFAGYRQEDGSVLGDPASIDLTDAIIELGWKPPEERSRWDVLPLVTMAENDDPYILELPGELRDTVRITHPRYQEQFRELDLQWVKAPALSRLGFDIGGVQYTATPFVGWFMDAEIGSRDLGDESRYNVSPAVIKALKLSDDPDTPFEDLAGYKQLAAVSRAQAELNYAVYHSFSQRRITMADSLTSSIQYQQFNDAYKSEKGFSLPADFGWLAPPQGSIIPLWHRGALPNYQPKPMICKHVQDPVKAWRREHPKAGQKLDRRIEKAQHSTNDEDAQYRINIFYCTTGASAAKMASRLRENMLKVVGAQNTSSVVKKERTLNELDLTTMREGDVVLIVASSAGDGEVPLNGKRFLTRHDKPGDAKCGARFSCFGNGDTSYADTYNGAAKTLDQVMTNHGCTSMLGAIFPGDSSRSNPDWTSFDEWVDCLRHVLSGKSEEKDMKQILEEKWTGAKSSGIRTATLIQSKPSKSKSMLHVALDIGDAHYRIVDHVKIFAPNPEEQTADALTALHLLPNQRLDWHEDDAITVLGEHVDLKEPFKSLDWYPGIESVKQDEVERLTNLPAGELIHDMHKSDRLSPDMTSNMCKSMRMISPRTFSAASALGANVEACNSSSNRLDLIVKVHNGGRFSDCFLSNSRAGSQLRFRITETAVGKSLEEQPTDAPLILFATGSGIGPIVAILQHRLRRKATGRISLFVGMKPGDVDLIAEILEETRSVGLIDVCEVVESNAKKERPQDRMLAYETRRVLSRKLRNPSCIVFICGNENAAQDAKATLTEIAGDSIEGIMGDRLLEEVFTL